METTLKTIQNETTKRNTIVSEIQSLNKTKKEIETNLFNLWINLYNETIELNDNMKIIKQKRKSLLKTNDIELLLEDKFTKEMVKAIVNYSESKCNLDFTQNKLLSDNETVNPLYISLSSFKFYFLNGGTKCNSNQEFISKLSKLRKDININKCEKYLSKNK